MANPKVLEERAVEHKRLEAVAKLLEATSVNEYWYDVKETYFDYGQNWIWTTIIAVNPNETGVLRSWQAITPKEWEEIINAESAVELALIVDNIKSGKFFRDK